LEGVSLYLKKKGCSRKMKLFPEEMGAPKTYGTVMNGKKCVKTKKLDVFLDFGVFGV